ncbi:MAG: WlaTC/HtrL family glycosyltransferase [Lachnospiraceae bacterium]
MQTQPTIVTGFFDLHRDEWNCSRRSTEKYTNAFAFWAGIQNNLVVYTNSQMAEEVRRIRGEKGLLNSTNIIVVDDYLSLDPELYNSIKSAMIQPASKQFHLKPGHPESWNPDYNYVMILKWWCVCDAIERGITGESVAWIDFGFNNCGTFYIDPQDFDFIWRCETDDKINLFCINKPDDTPVFEIVQKMETYVQGCSIVGPAKHWKEFRELVRQAVFAMNKVGFADDDQVYMLMAYRENPDLFKINVCPWFSIFQVTSDKTFLTRQVSPNTLGIKGALKAFMKRCEDYRLVCEYLKKQKKIMLNKNTIND